jgi:hypothetical protein
MKVVIVSKELFEDKESCVTQTEDLGGESDCVEARDGEVIREGVFGISEGRRCGGVLRIRWRSILRIASIAFVSYCT